MCTCLPCRSRCLPCASGGYDSAGTEEPLPGSPSVVRIALSVAAVAIGILSTGLFLVTDNLIALGLTVAFGIAAICLWPNQSCRSNHPPRPALPLHPTFGAPIGSVYQAAIPPPAPWAPSPMAMPRAVPISLAPWAPSPLPINLGSDSRVRVGHSGGNGSGPHPYLMTPPSLRAGPAEEQRVHVGRHESQAPFHSPPPSPARSEPAYAPVPPPGFPLSPQRAFVPGEQRIDVGRGGRIGFEPIPPPVSAHMAQHAGRGSRRPVASGQVGTGTIPSMDEERIPVGRGRR